MSTERRQLDITHEASSMPRTMYDERFLVPMRRDLTEVGFTELRSAQEVDEVLRDKPGTAMVVVNSVCGCSARMARPAARIAVGHEPRPDCLYTVFCWTGRRRNSPGPRLLHRVSALIALDRDPARRQAGVDAGAVADRGKAGGGDSGGAGAGV